MVSAPFAQRFTVAAATFLRAGVPLADAIERADISANAGDRKALGAIANSLRGGASLGEALAPYDRSFGELYIQFVRIAERAGTLPETFDRLQKHSAFVIRNQMRLVALCLYPVINLGTATMIWLFIMVNIVPQFQTMFAEFDIALPPATAALMAIGQYLQGSWLWLVVLILGLYLAFRALQGAGRRYPGCRAVTDGILMMIPVARRTIAEFSIGRGALVVSQLVSHGVGFSDALRIASEVRMNCWVSRWFESAADRIDAGTPPDDALQIIDRGTFLRVFRARGGALSPLAPGLVAYARWGMSTGDMSGSMERLADSYLRRCYLRMQLWAEAATPVAAFLTGLVVGFISLALFSCLVELANSMAPGG